MRLDGKRRADDRYISLEDHECCDSQRLHTDGECQSPRPNRTRQKFSCSPISCGRWFTDATGRWIHFIIGLYSFVDVVGYMERFSDPIGAPSALWLPLPVGSCLFGRLLWAPQKACFGSRHASAACEAQITPHVLWQDSRLQSILISPNVLPSDTCFTSWRRRHLLLLHQAGL